MFFLVFSMLLVGVAAGASDAAAGDTGVNRLVQVAVTAGVALLGGAQRRPRPSVALVLSGASSELWRCRVLLPIVDYSS